MVTAAIGAAAGVLLVPLIQAVAARLLRRADVPAVRGRRLTGALAVGGAAAAGAAVAALPSLLLITLYGVFAAAVLVAAVVDAVERRIPNRVTYPLLLAAVFVLPWLARPLTPWLLLAPLVGALLSGLWGLLSAVLADQGAGDVKLAAAVGAWLMPLGVMPWAVGLGVGQLLMVASVARTVLRRRRAGLPPDRTPLGPALALGAFAALAATQLG